MGKYLVLLFLTGGHFAHAVDLDCTFDSYTMNLKNINGEDRRFSYGDWFDTDPVALTLSSLSNGQGTTAKEPLRITKNSGGGKQPLSDSPGIYFNQTNTSFDFIINPCTGAAGLGFSGGEERTSEAGTCSRPQLDAFLRHYEFLCPEQRWEQVPRPTRVENVSEYRITVPGAKYIRLHFDWIKVDAKLFSGNGKESKSAKSNRNIYDSTDYVSGDTIILKSAFPQQELDALIDYVEVVR